MPKPTKKQLLAEATVGAATGGWLPWLLLKLAPRRWTMRSVLMVVALLVGLGIVKLKWIDGQPGVQIDLKRSAELEQEAADYIKSARERFGRQR